MDVPVGQKKADAIFNRPRALVCHICGREFGTTSLGIHQKTCARLWEERESKKPKKERKPLPQAPSEIAIGGVQDIEAHNKAASAAFEEQVMRQCPNCYRTFLEDRLEIHLRSCRPDRPHKLVGTGAAPREISRSPSPVRSKGFRNTFHPKKAEETKEEPIEMLPCQHCSKMFTADRIATHEKTCMKAGPGLSRPKTPTKLKPQTSELLRPSSSQPVFELVQCPYCKMKFSALTAETHIQSCQGSVRSSLQSSSTRVSSTEAPQSRQTTADVPTIRLTSADTLNPKQANAEAPALRPKSTASSSIASSSLEGATAALAFRIAKLLQAPKEKRYCPLCGEKYVAHGKFCAFCGAAK
mmetsp:Transcript_33350/g.58491  ORF Transcript_33350/g.58491 Transcript_33350/m.58491 type:complete len:355 (-) Transcript_33350:43-1107(-)